VFVAAAALLCGGLTARPRQHFAVESVDLADLSWSPDDTVICVQDTLLEVPAAAW
jgi:hypothetical protein